jgi:hypothetical protein
MKRIIESHNPQKEYPSTDNATYLKYRCEYCLKKFYLVDPDTYASGGAIQKEVLARDIMTREIAKVGMVFPACMRLCVSHYLCSFFVSGC